MSRERAGTKESSVGPPSAASVRDRESLFHCVPRVQGVDFVTDANRPGDATNAPGHDTGEVTPMRDKRSTVRPPFKVADLRDLERAAAAIERIRDRHPDEYDDYEFDQINQVRAAALEAIRDVEASG